MSRCARTTEPHPWLGAFIDPESASSAAETYERYEAWATCRREMFMFLANCDRIVTPAWVHPAPLHPEPGEVTERFRW